LQTDSELTTFSTALMLASTFVFASTLHDVNAVVRHVEAVAHDVQTTLVSTRLDETTSDLTKVTKH
jgi:hypothetical protein